MRSSGGTSPAPAGSAVWRMKLAVRAASRGCRYPAGVAATHDLNVELRYAEIALVEVGNSQFTVRRWLHVCREVAHLVVVEVQAGEGVV